MINFEPEILQTRTRPYGDAGNLRAQNLPADWFMVAVVKNMGVLPKEGVP